MSLDYRKSHAIFEKVQFSTTTWRLFKETFNMHVKYGKNQSQFIPLTGPPIFCTNDSFQYHLSANNIRFDCYCLISFSAKSYRTVFVVC